MKQIAKGLSVCLMLLWALALNAQQKERIVYYTAEDQAIFQRYIETMQPKRTLPMPSLMIQTALFFEGTPYVASTLEKEPEGLVINLRELDCTTFMETVLALCRTLQSDHPTFESYCDHLQHLRYRNNTITDYTDRLHYMADWFYENERKGIVKDMAQSIGGDTLSLNLSFISTHPDSYKQLKGHPEFVQKMEKKEREINQRPHYYLPKANINALSSGIQDGDILCFATTVKGLDVTHVALAYWQGGELRFIHASMSAMKVIVQNGSLEDYANSMKSCKGLLIARPLSMK